MWVQETVCYMGVQISIREGAVGTFEGATGACASNLHTHCEWCSSNEDKIKYN